MSSELSNPVYNPPLDPWLTIVHRDDDLLVLDKPSGLLSVPGRDPALSDSLMTRVQKQFPKALMINRLDKDTSGIVLMSLNRKAHAAIASQFENRQTRKSYVAIVWGEVAGEAGEVDLPLAIDPENKPRHRVDRERQAGTEPLAGAGTIAASGNAAGADTPYRPYPPIAGAYEGTWPPHSRR